MKTAQLLNEEIEDQSEDEIKKLKWKKDPDIQRDILHHNDLSEDFVLEVIENLLVRTRTFGDCNPKIFKSSKLMDAMTKRYISFKRLYKNTDFDYFKNAVKTPIDPDLLVSLSKHMITHKKFSELEYITGNINFPSAGFDDMKVGTHTLMAVLKCPNVDKKTIEDAIMEHITDDVLRKYRIFNDGNLISKLTKALGDRITPIKLSDDVADALLEKMKDVVAGRWFSGIIAGDQIDKVLDNMEQYYSYFEGGNRIGPTAEFSILTTISSNRNLTLEQKNKILGKINETSHGASNIIGHILTTDPNPDPVFFKETLKSKNVSIWSFWSFDNLYCTFDKDFVKIIDEMALSSTDQITDRVVIIRKTFSEWVKENNKNDENMSKETALKYLLHFFKYGDESLIKKIKKDDYKFIDSPWLELDDVKEKMFSLTGDIKYVHGPAKAFFVFPE